jgi:protocatechuate 4,5-dioxygenase alpha chain
MGNVDKVDRTLALNEMIYHVRKDPKLRQRWLEDLDGLAREFGLSEEELDVLKQKDVKRMSELGVHQYLITQIMRLFFGTGGASNVHPALEAFRRAYPEQFASARAARSRQ